MPGPGGGAGVGSVPVSEYNCVSHCAQHCLPLYVCSHCLAGMVRLQEDGLVLNVMTRIESVWKKGKYLLGYDERCDDLDKLCGLSCANFNIL